MEKKIKHTPGEWYVGRTDLFKGGDSMVVCPKTHYITDEGYRSICQVSPMEDADDEDFANALLIAASPDMLDFLTKMVNDYDDALIEDIEDYINKAHELIKKATGDE